MDDKLIAKTEEKIKEILDEDINPNNLDYLYKLTKIKHFAKEEKNMYGNYGRNSYGRDNYGNYNEYSEYGRERYGRRGYDAKYRGDNELDRLQGEYGRYMESYNRYGAGNEETDKSFHYMLKALEDFVNVLHEEAETPQQKQMIAETLQRSMR